MITVVQSDQLAEVQDAVRTVEKMSVFLLVVVIVLYVLAVFLAADRRVALRNVGLALGVGASLLIIGRHVAARYLAANVETANDARDAIHSIALIGTSILDEIAWLGFSIGLILFLYAVVVGPTRAAAATRRALAPVLRHRLGAWAVSLAVVALIVWITPGASVESWIGAVTLLVLFVAGTERLRSIVRREYPDTTFADVGTSVVQYFDGPPASGSGTPNSGVPGSETPA